MTDFQAILVKTPDSHDSDDVYFERKGNRITGFAFLGKKTGDAGLMRCPECTRENYAMAVLSGICSWCGFDAKELIKSAK